MGLIDWGVQKALTLSLDECKQENRPGFLVLNNAAQKRAESVSEHFVRGFNAGLELDGAELVERLNALDENFRVFAFEGSAMALYVRDQMFPWKGNRFDKMVEALGHQYLAVFMVGTGIGMARLPFAKKDAVERSRRLDPLYGWLALDGLGFHEGYFHFDRFQAAHEVPEYLPETARPSFDQGLGRAVYFGQCASARHVSERIAGFDKARQGDLWHGIGVALTFAGGNEESGIADFAAAAGDYFPHLATGVLGAAHGRARSRTSPSWTRDAVRIILGMTLDDAEALYSNICSRAAERHADDVRAQFPVIIELGREHFRDRLGPEARRAVG